MNSSHEDLIQALSKLSVDNRDDESPFPTDGKHKGGYKTYVKAPSYSAFQKVGYSPNGSGDRWPGQTYSQAPGLDAIVRNNKYVIDFNYYNGHDEPPSRSAMVHQYHTNQAWDPHVNFMGPRNVPSRKITGAIAPNYYGGHDEPPSRSTMVHQYYTNQGGYYPQENVRNFPHVNFMGPRDVPRRREMGEIFLNYDRLHEEPPS